MNFIYSYRPCVEPIAPPRHTRTIFYAHNAHARTHTQADGVERVLLSIWMLPWSREHNTRKSRLGAVG